MVYTTHGPAFGDAAHVGVVGCHQLVDADVVQYNAVKIGLGRAVGESE